MNRIGILLLSAALLMQFPAFAEESATMGFGENSDMECIRGEKNLVKPESLPDHLDYIFEEYEKEVRQVMPTEGKSLSGLEVENTDGTMSMFMLDTPIKYYDENSEIQYKDLALLEDAADEAYKPAANEFESFIYEDAEKGSKVKNGEKTFTIKPKAKQNGKKDKTNKKGKLKKTKKKDVVEFENAVSESVDIETTPTLQGFDNKIVIGEYNGDNEVSFTVNTPGVRPSVSSGKTIPMVDKITGETLFSVEIGELTDSHEGPAADGEVHMSAENTLQIAPAGGDDYTLTAKLDSGFLARAYSAADVNIKVEVSPKNFDDTTVYSAKPSTQTFAANEYMMVGYHDSEYGQGIGYVKSTNINDYYYLNPAMITSAYYHVYEGSGKSSSSVIELWDCSANWSPSSVTWNNRPAVSGSAPVASKTVTYSTNTNWYDFNITSLVKNWINYSRDSGGKSSQLGFILKAQNASASSRHFFAEEGTYPPYIYINYKKHAPDVTNGYYSLKNDLSNLYLDDKGGIVTENNPLQQWNFNECTAQVFKIKRLSNGMYTIALEKDLSYLVAVNTTSPGDATKAVIKKYTGTTPSTIPAQAQWKIVKYPGASYYKIVNQAGDKNKCLEIAGPSVAPNALAQVWSTHTGANMRWHLLQKPYKIRTGIFYDQAMASWFDSDAEARQTINSYFTDSKNLYLNTVNANIYIFNFSKITSAADGCPNGKYEYCRHTALHKCWANNIPAYNEIFKDNNYIGLRYSGHPICDEENGVHTFDSFAGITLPRNTTQSSILLLSNIACPRIPSLQTCVMIHELGHAIGRMGDTQHNNQCIMSADGVSDEDKYNRLTSDPQSLFCSDCKADIKCRLSDYYSNFEWR